MYLVVVLLAGTVTAVWAGPKLGADLSAITTFASVLGITERTGTTRPVGYAVASAEQPSATTAGFCAAGQVPTFSAGLANLRQRVGDVMGTPVECAHEASASGDSVQQTTTGLAAYFSLSNTVTFTDGWRHWAMTPTGYVTWEGPESLPPTANGPGAG